MSGLMRRFTRRRAAEPEPAAGPPDAPAGDSVERPDEPSLLEDPARSRSEDATEELPAAERPFAEPAPAAAPPPSTDDLPAGLDPDQLAAAPDSSARRGRLRRRVEFLRSARELLLRDLGGFVFELHRTARDSEQEGHRRLRETKLARLDAVEAELHALERRLNDPRPRKVVHEPGVGGECHRCGELFGSAAHYCAHCGAPLTEGARRRQIAERAHVAEAGEPAEVAAHRSQERQRAGGPAETAAGPSPAKSAGSGTGEPAHEPAAAKPATGGPAEPAREPAPAKPAGGGPAEPAREPAPAKPAAAAGGTAPAKPAAGRSADAAGARPAADVDPAGRAAGAERNGSAPDPAHAEPGAGTGEHRSPPGRRS